MNQDDDDVEPLDPKDVKSERELRCQHHTVAVIIQSSTCRARSERADYIN